MSDENNPALLDRVVTGLRDFVGQPGHRQTKNNAECVHQQLDADPALWREYLQTAVMHPDAFENDEATVVSNVETVVSQFARDGLTRSRYFKALAADPQLLLRRDRAGVRTIADHSGREIGA